MPIKSRYPKIEIPNIDTWTLLFERKERPYRDDKVIFHDTASERSYTYAQLRGTAIGFGQALRSAWNWQKDDVLAVYSPNDIDYPAVIFGCHWGGGIVTTANPGYTARELATQLRDSGAKAIVTQAPFLKTALEAARDADVPRDRVILMGQSAFDPPAQHFTRLKGFRVVPVDERPPRPASIDPREDLCFLVYSSGTTGKPKGVMLTHMNVVANTLMLTASNEGFLACGDGTTGSGDKTIGLLPFFHIYGLTGVLHVGLYAGYEVFVMPSFELKKFCEVVQKERITYNNIVPRIVLALAKDVMVDQYDLSSLRMLISAAAPLTKDLVEMVYKRLNIPVKQAYGLSETSPGTHQQEWSEWDKGIGSIGRPLSNQEAKIVSVDGDVKLKPGEAGELWLRGPNVFKGYLNNPEATAASLTPDNWFKTGDVGYVDEDGLFFITDRIKELIKYNGFQVAPAELEGLLVSHPKVKDAAVIGIYDKDAATELPRAYIVAEHGTERDAATAREIGSWLQGRVAKHKRLRGGVRFIDAIPASAAGKILRRELKDLAAMENEQTKSKL